MHNTRRLLSLAPLLLLAAASAMSALGRPQQPPHVRVLATDPEPPHAIVGKNATFYIRYRVDAEEPVVVSIEAYDRGQRLSTGNSGLSGIPAGGGTNVSFFFLLSGRRQEVDQVRLLLQTTGRPQRRWTFSVPVALTFDPAASGTTPAVPPWVTTWRKEQEAAMQANASAAGGRTPGRPGAALGVTLLLGLLALGLPLASIALPIWAIRRWQGRWRVLALVPVGVIALKLLSVLAGVARDPTSHTLWPLEIALWEIPGLGFLGLAWLARRAALARAANRPGA